MGNKQGKTEKEENKNINLASYEFKKDKSNLKLKIDFETYLSVVSRKMIQLKIKKVGSLSKKRNDIINLLRKGDYEKAKFSVEFLKRDEDAIKACELVSQLCNATKEQVSYILASGGGRLPAEDSRQIIDSIVYASLRFDLEEFTKLREIIEKVFGKMYLDNAGHNASKYVNENLVKYLSLEPYPIYTLIEKLNFIAVEEKIEINFPSNWFNHPLDFNMGGNCSQVMSNELSNNISNNISNISLIYQ